MKEEFKQKYIEKVLNGSGFDEELNQMFEAVLLGEMNDDPEKMSEFVQSIVDEYTPQEPSDLELLKAENQKLQAAIKSMEEESEMMQTAFMEISDYIFSK